MLDWIAGGCELTASYLIGNKRRLGFIFNVVGCSLWVYVAIQTSLYGLLLVVVPAIGLNLRNWWKWRKALDSKDGGQ